MNFLSLERSMTSGQKNRYLFKFILAALIVFSGIACLNYKNPDLEYTVSVNTTEGPEGVPTIAELSSANTGYQADGVVTWWQNHKFNPDHSSQITKIKSTTPIIDVYADYASDIQAAIDALPATGGTLFFAPTTFEIPEKGLYLAEKNNVHFIGTAGKTVFIAQSRETMITLECGPGEISGYPDCYSQPTSNYLFENIIFDGNNVSNKALSLYSVKNVLVRNCTFKNYLTHENGGDAMIHSGAWADNIWIIDSVFTGRGKHAIILDGTHYSGIINSSFDHYIYPTAIIFLSNDDLSRDVDYDSTWDPNEIRLSNYIVIEGNTFGAAGDKNVSSISGHLRNSLIQENTVKGNGHFFAHFDARCSQIAVNTNLVYEFYFHKILNNTIDGRMNYFAEFYDGHNNNCVPAGSTSYLGKYDISNNTINGGIVVLPIRHCNSDHTIQTPNTISGNTNKGAAANWSATIDCP